MTAHLRVGVWCAVSSRPQAEEEKESLPAQRRAGEEFARAVNGEVVAVYEVSGHTRDYWSWFEAEKEMLAYKQIREDLQAGKLDVVHCLDVDRLGRDPALIHQFYSLAERHGAEVYDASMPHILGQQSMGHRYGMSVKSVSAGEDQRRRVIRHRMGMRGRVKHGLHPGNWPLGYRAVRDESGEVIGAEFTDLIGSVSLMTRLFLSGHSYNRIRLALDASTWVLPDGRPWYEVLVRRTLQSDVYAGYVSWGDARNEEPSDRYPALWDEATYAAILRERENRNQSYRRPTSGPLSGIVFCHRCGGAMGRLPIKNQDDYYLRCTRHYARTKRPNTPACHPNHIRESVVLATLQEWVSRFTTPEAIEVAMARSTNTTDYEAEIDRLKQQLQGLGTKRHRLALAFAEGKMDLSIYHDADEELRAREDAAKARLSEMQVMLAARPDPKVRRAYIEQLLAEGPDLGALDPDILGDALHRAGVQVYVEDRQVQFCAFAL